jgi:hypothetical protein
MNGSSDGHNVSWKPGCASPFRARAPKEAQTCHPDSRSTPAQPSEDGGAAQTGSGADFGYRDQSDRGIVITPIGGS